MEIKVEKKQQKALGGKNIVHVAHMYINYNCQK